jgi:hypothetical protein
VHLRPLGHLSARESYLEQSRSFFKGKFPLLPFSALRLARLLGRLLQTAARWVRPSAVNAKPGEDDPDQDQQGRHQAHDDEKFLHDPSAGRILGIRRTKSTSGSTPAASSLFSQSFSGWSGMTCFFHSVILGLACHGVASAKTGPENPFFAFTWIPDRVRNDGFLVSRTPDPGSGVTPLWFLLFVNSLAGSRMTFFLFVILGLDPRIHLHLGSHSQ